MLYQDYLKKKEKKKKKKDPFLQPLHYRYHYNGPEVQIAMHQRVEPIFHCDAKPLASGPGVGLHPQRHTFALGIPTCWYLKMRKHPTPNLKFLFYPTRNPIASQWNIGCVGSQRKILASAMYISFFVCRFHSRWVANAKPISSGIWA